MRHLAFADAARRWLRERRASSSVTASRSAIAFAALCAALPIPVALSAWRSGDYMLHGAVSGDNAGPALSALAHGHLSAFLANQPLMGLTSIVVRLPFAALAGAAHAGELTAYRLGALACLLPAGLLCGWIVAGAGASAKRLLAAVLGAIVVIAGPATSSAVLIGHPEEVLASTLASAAVLAALARRPHLAAVLLGLAVGTKQWALLATLPVLIAAGSGRLRIAVLAGAVAVLMTAALPIADPSAFARAKSSVFGGHLTDPWSVWWPFASVHHSVFEGSIGTGTAFRLPLGLARSSASTISLSLALGGLAVFALRRRRQGSLPDPLALLALLGLLRCMSDPTPLQYNFVDVLIPLALWEAAGLKRLPAISYAAMGTVWLLTERLVHAPASLLSALSLVGALTLSCYLAHRALGTVPGRSRRVLIFGAQEPITGT
jgi:hypothetical protein